MNSEMMIRNAETRGYQPTGCQCHSQSSRTASNRGVFNVYDGRYFPKAIADEATVVIAAR